MKKFLIALITLYLNIVVTLTLKETEYGTHEKAEENTETFNIELQPNYGLPPHSPHISSIFDQLTKSIELRQANKSNTTIKNKKYHDITDYTIFWYTLCIQIGTYSKNSMADKKFCLVLDTGSSDLWVLDSMKYFNPIYVNETIAHFYNSSASLTSKLEYYDEELSIQYLKGMVKGIKYRDSVKIDNLSVTNQGFLSVFYLKNVYMFFENNSFDGIWGMSFKLLSKTLYTPLLDNIFKQYSVKNRQFTFDFSSNKHKPRLIIGKINQSKYKNGKTKVPIQRVGIQFLQQMILPDTIFVSSNGYKFYKTDYCYGCNAFLDTGTSFFGVPRVFYDYFVKALLFGDSDAIENKDCQQYNFNYWYCKKSHLSKMHNFVIKIRGKSFVFEPKDYTFTIKQNSEEFISPKISPIYGNDQIFGIPWFQKVQTTLDCSNDKEPYALFVNQNYAYRRMTPLIITIVVLGAIVMGFGVIALIQTYIRRRRARQSLLNESSNNRYHTIFD